MAKPLPGSSFELYAQAMLDHWLGKQVSVEFERDDGYADRSDIAGYFAPPSDWFAVEREAMREARGRVLDIGCGPGRHALHLQKRGLRVVGIDASATQVALARIRGLREVYQASVWRLPKGLGVFDTVILMGNNLGLPGDLPEIQAIYAHHVLRGLASFEEVPPDLEEMRRRHEAMLAAARARLI